MKSRISYLAATVAIAAMSTLVGCTSAYYTSTSGFSDDLYGTHDRNAIAQQVALERSQARQAAEAAARAEREYQQQNSGNPYEDILADDYESAYARRLKGFDSPTYKMPSSYQNFRYGSDYNYATAYDPSFYNVMVMGDQVWVEPKYVTSMFGTWGRPVNVNINFGSSWGSGWGNPYWNSGWGGGWNNGYYGWNNGWGGGWGNPYYGWNNGWGGGWGNPYYGWNGGWGHNHYPGWGNHYPGWGRPYYDKNTTYRPSYSNGGSNNSGGYRQPSKYSGGNGTTYRSPSGTTTYRRGDSKTNSSTNRNDNNNSYNKPTTQPSYNSGSTTSRPSYGGGSSSSGSSSSGSTTRGSVPRGGR